MTQPTRPKLNKRTKPRACPLPLKPSDIAMLQGLAIRHIDWEGSRIARYSLDDDIEDAIGELAENIVTEVDTSRVADDAMDVLRDCVETAVRGVYAWEYAKLIKDRGFAP